VKLKRVVQTCLAAVAALAFFAAAPLAIATPPTGTTTTLKVAAGGSVVTSVSSGTAVTLTATVLLGVTPVTTGQVNFCDATAAHCTDVHLLGQAQLTASGTAVFKFRPGPGSHSYKAIFVGTSSAPASTSATAALTVTPPSTYPTTTTLSSSGSAGNYTLSATVIGNGPQTPSGTLSFLDITDSSSVIETAALTAGAAQLSFAGISNPATGNGVVTGDWNGDGIPDLAIIDGSSVYVLTGNGDGTFTQSAILTNPPNAGSENYFTSITTADFNGDGIPDIAVAQNLVSGNPSAAVDGVVAIYLGKGDGTFTQVSTSPTTGMTPFAIVAADFNRDGIPDLAIPNQDGTLTVLIGSGAGTFTSVANPEYSSANYANTDVSFYTQSIASADFNRDGIPDLAVVNQATGAVAVLLGVGDGTFTVGPTLSTSSPSTAVLSADFNGDGIPDLAIASSSTSQVSIYQGNGDGSFTATTPGAIAGTSISVVDINGDGIPDLVTTQGNAGTLGVYLGDGQGDFTAATLGGATSGAGPSLAAADFNGDGVPDVAGSGGSLFLTETQSATATATGVAVLPAGSGSHNVEASFAAESDYGASTSAPVVLSAALGTPTVVLGSAGSSATYSTLVTFTATVTGAGFAPTGQVNFYDANTYLGVGTLTSGVAAFSTSTLAIGPHSIAARYLGDTNYNAVNSSASAFTVTTPNPATMTAPAPGAALAGSSVTFNWNTATGAEGYYLWIGTTGTGSSNLYYSALKTVTSYTFNGIPTNGETIYVRLITNFDGTWVSNDYTYTAAKAAAMSSPAQSATLGGLSVAFNWSAVPGATGYYLWIGTTGVGSSNLYYSAPKTGTSYTFNSMPINGETIYVRLITNLSGTWVSNDYTYTAAKQGVSLTSPTPGSTFSNSSVTFTWAAGPGATGYYLWIGTTGVGSSDLYYSAEKTVTSYTFTRMPTNGETIYVRLTTNYSGTWVYKDYTYTASSPAVLTSPTPGSAFTSSSVTFNWTTQTSASGYYLWIGTTGVGSSDLYYSAEKTVTSYTFTRMPTNGETIYVRLITNFNGSWSSNDYTYTAAPSQP
jgi:hypothetical protein